MNSYLITAYVEPYPKPSVKYRVEIQSTSLVHYCVADAENDLASEEEAHEWARAYFRSKAAVQAYESKVHYYNMEEDA